MEDLFRVRVYYEDTDSMGVVYHANYLRFFERARSELFSREIAPIEALQQKGSRLMVHQVEMSLKAPAGVGDELLVRTRPEMPSRYRLVFEQQVEREVDGEVLVTASIGVVNVGGNGKIKVLPDTVRARLGEKS